MDRQRQVLIAKGTGPIRTVVTTFGIAPEHERVPAQASGGLLLRWMDELALGRSPVRTGATDRWIREDRWRCRARAAPLML